MDGIYLRGVFTIRHAFGSPKLISFIIPTLNKTALLEQCLSSIHKVCMSDKPPYLDYEIIVVQDGNSQDVTSELQRLNDLYHFRLFQTGRACGYTRTINHGIRKAAGDLIILLNDDICFEQNDWLALMLKSLQLHPKVGVIGCRLLYPDRRIQHGGMCFTDGIQLLGHKHWGQPEDVPDALKVHRTIALTGAILAIKRDVVNEIGFLNENFIMLCSDTDYCLTAHQHGWIVIYNGRSYAIHHESQTRRQFKYPNRLSKLESHDLYKFYMKWSSDIKHMHLEGMI